ncbi:S8 family serine peptidase [Rufibacter glacialis]|uniref:S8 family serine peptidase n=1 Tax=Rufibacter glacialis TaxID=1259555 RepID=A0ABV4RJI6_9BACT|nr:S8 family serine peptidase [Rufibacter glacialis]
MIFFIAGFLAGFPSSESKAQQQRYWVHFKDKPAAGTRPLVTEAALAKRRLQALPLSQPSDAPVHQAYLDSLAARGFPVTSVSKWLNAAVIMATSAQAEVLGQAPYVQDLKPITGFFSPSATAPFNPQYMGKALTQLKPEALLAAGLTGRGVKVGVIDAGFYEAPQKAGLQAIFEEGRLKAYRDFVNPTQSQVFHQRESGLDSHGTDVLLCLGGSDPAQRVLSGFAHQADYYLARTDHGGKEARIEEEYFVRALEWMDSLGVRLVNSSLGYGTGFDNPAENYLPAQMDGSSFIARAVQMAVEQKGMVLVIAAGNDGGNKKWRVVNTPADAPGVLTVGATNFTTWTKQGYSSIGPSFLPYLKPDVACFASSGTSFSAPIIAGLAACLLEENPALTPRQLTDIIKQSSHLYPFGNNFVGYGVPNAAKALELVQGFSTPWAVKETIQVKGKRFVYKHTPSWLIEDNGGVVLYRKKSPQWVMAQQKRPAKQRKIIVKRRTGETHTTLQVGSKVVELVWH